MCIWVSIRISISRSHSGRHSTLSLDASAALFKQLIEEQRPEEPVQMRLSLSLDHPPWLIYGLKYNEPELALCSHMDTVEPPTKLWTEDRSKDEITSSSGIDFGRVCHYFVG